MPHEILFVIKKKSSILIGIILTGIILTTIVYLGASTDNYYRNQLNILFNNSNGHHHRHSASTRVLCLILTSPRFFLTRTKAVNETWAPRCDRYFFVTEPTNETTSSDQLKFANQIPIAPIKNITPGYDHLTQKSNLAFLFAYENYINDFDWFVKADDDTYLFVDHLKAFLSEQNTSEPVTFGYNLKVHPPERYHSGGASYVLSREALRRFYQAHQDPNSNCRKDGGSEDVEIAKCLRNRGVYPGKSLDEKNRELFHPLSFYYHFLGRFPDWLQTYAENPPQSNYNCCSDQTISFHYVAPEEQYLMDFLSYRMRSRPNNKPDSSMCLLN